MQDNLMQDAFTINNVFILQLQSIYYYIILYYLPYYIYKGYLEVYF